MLEGGIARLDSKGAARCARSTRRAATLRMTCSFGSSILRSFQASPSMRACKHKSPSVSLSSAKTSLRRRGSHPRRRSASALREGSDHECRRQQRRGKPRIPLSRSSMFSRFSGPGAAKICRCGCVGVVSSACVRFPARPAHTHWRNDIRVPSPRRPPHGRCPTSRKQRSIRSPKLRITGSEASARRARLPREHTERRNQNPLRLLLPHRPSAPALADRPLADTPLQTHDVPHTRARRTGDPAQRLHRPVYPAASIEPEWLDPPA